MNARLVRIDDAVPQQWRNGGGVTRELLAWPRHDGWRVRISVADIRSDGPFSPYPGVLRWFAVVEGAGVELTLDGVARRQARSDAPWSFDGAAAPDCRLIGGPTRDLNLMLRAAQGCIDLAGDDSPWRPGAAMCGLFTAVAGRCGVDDCTFDLPGSALLWFQVAPHELTFVAGEPAAGVPGWWIAVTIDGAAGSSVR